MRSGIVVGILLVVSMFTCAMSAAQTARHLITYKAGTNLVGDAQIEVSSAAGKPGQKYSFESLNDEDLSTWWASGSNLKLPQWIKVSFDKPAKLDTIIVVLAENPAIYTNWKRVAIEFSDGSSVSEQLEDRPGAFIIRFPQTTTEWFQINIVESYEEKVYYAAREVLAFYDPDKEIGIKVPPKKRWQQVNLTETGRESHPCVYITPDDVERAKQNIEKHDWAKKHAEGIIAAADGVVDKDPAWIRENCPGKGTAFAYGFTGCPICGAKWGSWGGANCSFERPGTVKCRSGHILPDADHPDDGTGYVAEDGRIHYFVGSYNAWVVETYQKWCRWLSFAYIITGEEEYAKTAAVLLDAIAEIYPSCDAGSWDYPSSPPSGRLCRPWYQVSRVLVTLVDYYDKIYNSPALDEPSFVEGLTRRENIEANMLKNGAWYCYEQSLKGGMHNGEADYVRGALSVGCLLGIEAYVDWAVDGPYGIYAMVYNNADRNGRYIESSLGYAVHARSLYLTFAEPLINYRSEKYPEGLNLYDDASFRSFYVLPKLSMDCTGHWPRYGDSGPDSSHAYPSARMFDPTDYAYAERIFIRTTASEVENAFGALVNFFAGGNLDKVRAGSRDKEWLLFHADKVPDSDEPISQRLQRMASETTLMGQKGIAILRTPHSKMAQACLLRYGPVLNHGHYDDLNINYFGLGYELTYDLGYGNGSTHTQVGWSKQTASHQLVLVDEACQLTGEGDDSGGSLHLLAAMPGMQVVDADANNCYASRGVEVYRRFLALVGDGPDSYLLDIFNVEGGQQHDYVAHSLSTDIGFAGVELGEREEGSVAGPEFNWGERQLNDGFMSGVPQRPYWRPPPANGLGFMMHPRRGQAVGPWSATWKLPEGNNYMRLTMLPQEDTEVINAWAPGTYPQNPKAEHIMARRVSDSGPLKSTFVAIREPYGPVPVEAGGIQAADLMSIVSTEDGIIKYLGSYGIVLFQAQEFGGEVHFDLQTPADGAYYLIIAPYMSPNYGAAQFILDGKAVGEPFVANSPSVKQGPLQILGPMDLKAGKHRLTVRTVEFEGGQPWISIKAISLTQTKPEQQATQASPFIGAVEKLPAPEGTVALAVKHVSGLVDRFVYAGTPLKNVTCGDIELDGCFSRLRSDAGEVVEAHLVGKLLNGPGFTMELANGQHSGKIVRIDYQKNLVYVDTELPTDGRLDYQTVAFNNPAYTRNTAYTIHGVSQEGNLSVIDLGTQRIILGQGTVHEDPLDDHLLYSLTAHDYARGLTRGGVNFFDGKLLRSEDGQITTNIISAKYAQPFEVRVLSTAGLKAGDSFYYYDLQAGDEFVIYNWAALSVDETGKLQVTATDDVTLTIGDNQQQLPWSPPAK